MKDERTIAPFNLMRIEAYLGLTSIVLIILRLCDVITLSWSVVFLPLEIGAAILLIVMGIAGIALIKFRN